MGTLYERVVGFWDGEDGERVNWAGVYQYGEFGVDGRAVGVLCTVNDMGVAQWDFMYDKYFEGRRKRPIGWFAVRKVGSDARWGQGHA